MQCLYIFAFLLPVVLASVPVSQKTLLQARDSNSKTVCGDEKRQRNCAAVNLRCRTGPNGDGFEVEISPLGGGKTEHEQLLAWHPDAGSDAHSHPVAHSRPHSHADIPEITATGTASSNGDYSYVGKMVDLVRSSSSRTCTAQRNNECSYAHSATAAFHLKTRVPGSQTPLVWVAHVHVDLECLVVPLNPEGRVTGPRPPTVNLGQCEHFNHTIEIFPVPEPAACLVQIKMDSSVARQSVGYTLQKCFLTLPGQSIPVITNGRTQKSARAEVTGRSVDGGSGLAYQLYLQGLSPAQVQAGSLRCEAARCRSSVVATEDYAQCIQGALPADFIASAGRAFTPVFNTAGVVGTPLRGDVKLYIPRAAISRSGPARVEECPARSGSVY